MPMLPDRPTNCFDLFWTGSFHQLRPAIAGHWSLKLNQTPLVFQKFLKHAFSSTQKYVVVDACVASVHC